MNFKNYYTMRVTGLLLIIFILFFSGIIRHDVSVEEYKSLANQSRFDCVSYITNNNDKDTIGSCVLISPKIVLSAGHMFVKTVTKMDTVRENGSVTLLPKTIGQKQIESHGLKVYFKGKWYSVKRIAIHPEYFTTKGRDFDIAVLELTDEVFGITPATLYPEFNELGKRMIGVGCGNFGIGNDPKSVSQGRTFLLKLGGENMIDSIGGAESKDFPGKNTLLYSDFDSPNDPSLNLLGDDKALPLEFMPTGGDSGTGYFIEVNGKLFLAGIFKGSRIDVDRLDKYGYYGQLFCYTRVSTMRKFIFTSNF